MVTLKLRTNGCRDILPRCRVPELILRVLFWSKSQEGRTLMRILLQCWPLH